MRAVHAAASVLALAAVLAVPAAEAAWGMPEALTERGETVGEIYDTIAILGILVFIIVFVWLVVVIWRFRETTGHGRATHEKERHSLKAELAWFLIPLALVLYIGGIAYAGLVELDHGIPVEDTELEVKVIGSQWSWTMVYPNGVSVNSAPDSLGRVANESVFLLPADTPILFNVTASDVIHAFQVLDANHAFVMFIDANPSGATKYNLQTARLPPGEYYVQCNKMCMNPGHAYMRARMQAVPRADYDLWVNERGAIAGASPSLVQSLVLQVQGGRLVDSGGSAVQPLEVVSGTRVVVQLRAPPQDVTFRVGSESKTIRAGESADPFFGFTLDATGETLLEASVGNRTERIAFDVIDAERLEVELGSFRLVPEHIPLEARQTYLISIPNTHNTGHNLFIGRLGGEVLAQSPTINGGETTTFRVKIDEAGTYDMWCNIPGHVGLGMTGKVTVS
jgi:heme/copper-type cytochrome/quinol oxidase subunit 2